LSVRDETIRLNIWDFGGQEIMHATHQFFLTKRSIYLLILDNRQNEQQNRLEYWLKIIQAFGGNSPIIIVGNHLDEHVLDLNKRILSSKYKTIKAIVSISCKDGRGLDTLKKKLAEVISQLTHVNDPLPLAWFNLKARLEGMKEDCDFISYESYQNICAQESIEKPSDQKILVQFLHDLGIVLNFQDDPRLQETNVLNPQWITTGIYKILNNNALITKYQGILERSRLSAILDDSQRYPDSKYQFLFSLMRKFELCFDLEMDQRFLIPDLLPKEEPDTGNWDGAMRFEYHYEVLPSSIISRFIVRTHRLISRNTRWRSGVVLKQGANNSALVRSDEEDRKITVLIKGSQTRTLLEIIRSNFDDIHDTIQSIEVEERLGLPNDSKVTVSYRHLLDLESEGEDSFIPEGSRRKYSVQDLLDGLEASESRVHRRDRRDNRDRYLARLEAEREVQQKDKVEKFRLPNPWSMSLLSLLMLGAVSCTFTAIAHFVPEIKLLIVVVAILLAFPVVTIVVLRLTGLIDDATFNRVLEGFWKALPLLKGGKTSERISSSEAEEKLKSLPQKDSSQ